MKKSKQIVLGLVLMTGVSLAACGDSNRQEEEEEGYYGSSNHSRVYYNRMGSPYYHHEDNYFRPLPADHPYYASAVKEGQAISSGQQSYRESVTVRRSGFGSSATLHLASAGS